MEGAEGGAQDEAKAELVGKGELRQGSKDCFVKNRALCVQGVRLLTKQSLEIWRGSSLPTSSAALSSDTPPLALSIRARPPRGHRP